MERSLRQEKVALVVGIIWDQANEICPDDPLKGALIVIETMKEGLLDAIEQLKAELEDQKG